MLQTRLNQGLHKINLHPTGLCEQCSEIQDCKHFIFKCKTTEELRKEISKWAHSEIRECKYEEVLNKVEVLYALVKFCSKHELII